VSKHRPLAYGQPIPQDFLDALQEFVSTAAPNLSLVVAGANTVQIIAGTGNAQVSLGINGLWRYVSGTVNATVTGAAGTYDIFATTGANSFAVNPSPPPPEVDNTDYTFALTVVAHGQTPGVANYRKIAEVIFDGTRITSLRQMIGNVDGATQWQTGDIKMTAVQTPPAGWLRCDGSTVSRATYAALFAALGGTTSPWGQGDGSTTFNLPDFRGRAPIGAGQGAGLSNRVAGSYGGGTLDANSPKLGEERHLLANGEMPVHSHGAATGNDSPDHAHNVSGGTGTESADHAHYVPGQSAGGATDWRTADTGGSYAPVGSWSGYSPGSSSPGGNFPRSGSPPGASNFNHQHGVSVNVGAVTTGGRDTAHSHAFNVGSAGASARHAHGIGNDGGGGDHLNMPPWIAVPYLVKT
jgi:microcystin-dependent protein